MLEQREQLTERMGLDSFAHIAFGEEQRSNLVSQSFEPWRATSIDFSAAMVYDANKHPQMRHL